MSNRSASVGGTLAGGIQDVSALLPLIGTEQCEKHVGSALTGGYLYAAGTPVSIFGSLGIVKGGITILISSISIPIYHVSILFSNYKLSFKLSSRRKWLGGRVLKDAGFQLVGSVAPLIGMEGDRFRAETRLLEMLEEKHIDDPEKVSVDWKSRQWNIMLILSTILGAFLSMTPYIALLLGPASWRPNTVHLPWLFPVLRIVGSCTAVITCQFIIQCRVISLMKNRLLFMTIDQKIKEIHKDKLNAWLKDSNIKWDAALPAEQCIWSLEQYLSVGSSSTAITPVEDSKCPEQSSVHSPAGTPNIQDHIAIELDESVEHTSSAAPSAPAAESPAFKIVDLHDLQLKNSPSPLRDTIFISLSWVFLLLSLPATVAGYIGCFTLVSATPSLGNGPLIWVGLEAALSIFRILVWASNPAFDEETEVTLGIKLSDHQPMATTIDHNPFITDFHNKKRKPFALIPEREFLEHITPYTGPLNQFEKPNNITLYFTLTIPGVPEHTDFIMTVLTSDTQIATSIVFSETSFQYVDVVVKYDTITRQLEGHLQSERRTSRPWRVEDDNLFDSLEGFYHYITRALHHRDIKTPTATLFQKWDLFGKSQSDAHAHTVHHPVPTLPLMSPEHILYLDRGYENHLKSELIDKWSRWISEDMECLRAEGRLECWEALRDATSKKGIWELIELDCQLAWGWTRRELALVKLSMDLEDILQTRMNGCVLQVVDARKDERLRARMSSEHGRKRQKRMVQERGAAKKRMEAAMKVASEQAEKAGQPGEKNSSFLPQWTDVIEFIDKQWSLAIDDVRDRLKEAEDKLQEMEREQQKRKFGFKDRNATLEPLRERVSHQLWHDQGEFERQIVEATVEAIRKLSTNSTREQLAEAYRFPEPDRCATDKFVPLAYSSSKGKACSAMVYDAFPCRKEIVFGVIAKSTTRSVVNVDPRIVASIPRNDHLLYLRCFRGEGKEPAFVQQNRDRWLGQQTENSSMFYFTPSQVVEDRRSCSVYAGASETIAHILVFLTSSSNLRVSLIHRVSSDKPMTVSLRQNGTELAKLKSGIFDEFKLQDFPPFVLPEGTHELKVAPASKSKQFFAPDYHLRDILITFSPIITIESRPRSRSRHPRRFKSRQQN